MKTYCIPQTTSIACYLCQVLCASGSSKSVVGGNVDIINNGNQGSQIDAW